MTTRIAIIVTLMMLAIPISLGEPGLVLAGCVVVPVWLAWLVLSVHRYVRRKDDGSGRGGIPFVQSQIVGTVGNDRQHRRAPAPAPESPSPSPRFAGPVAGTTVAPRGQAFEWVPVPELVKARVEPAALQAPSHRSHPPEPNEGGAHPGTDAPPDRPPPTKTGRKRSPTAPLHPDHFKRHAGIPGYLYVARNTEHRDSLFKVGYALKGGEQRMETLNSQARGASDIGRFVLVHCVEVAASYDSEQLAFEMLAEFRVASTREFFDSPVHILTQCIDAVAAQTSAGFERINEMRARASAANFDRRLSSDWEPHAVPVSRRDDAQAGWAYIMRNGCHRPGTFRLGYSMFDPEAHVKRLNAIQRRLTCQIGFFRLVHCPSVHDPAATFKRMLKLIAAHRVEPRKPFFNAPLPHLIECLKVAATQAGDATGQARGSNAPSERFVDPIEADSGAIAAKPVRGPIRASWAAWAQACPGCGVVLRFMGKIGESASVECPDCRHRMVCTQGAHGVRVARHH